MTRENVYEAAIQEFNEKSLKFTMDDIAKRLSMSKKTLYQMFKDKEELFLMTIDYGFDAIKESERSILEDPTMTTVEKIGKIIVALPDRYRNVDFRKLYALKDRYPKIYEEVARRIESDWEPTLELLRRGIEEGTVRPVNLTVLKSMIEATIEHFLETDVLLRDGIGYEEALGELIDIVMRGITA